MEQGLARPRPADEKHPAALSVFKMPEKQTKTNRLQVEEEEFFIVFTAGSVSLSCSVTPRQKM